MFGIDPTMPLPVSINIPQAPPLPALSNMQTPSLPQFKAGGMFGGGGDWRTALAAAAAGFLSRRNPQAAQMVMQPVMQKRQMEMQQQQQANELQRQKDLYTFELQNPKPDTPDIVQRIAALNAITPGLGDTYAHNYANNGGGSLIQFVDPSTGQRYAVPSGGASQLPPIGTVIDDPRRSGGQTPPASDGFR